MHDVAYFPILIVKGDDFLLDFSYNSKDCDSNELTPKDLTSYTVEGWVVDNSGNQLLQFAASILDAPNGVIRILLTNVQTNTLTGLGKSTSCIGTYYVQLTDISNKKQTIIRGKANLLVNEGV